MTNYIYIYINFLNNFKMSIFTFYIIFWSLFFNIFKILINFYVTNILCQNIHQYIFNISDISIKLKYQYISDYQYFHHWIWVNSKIYKKKDNSPKEKELHGMSRGHMWKVLEITQLSQYIIEKLNKFMVLKNWQLILLIVWKLQNLNDIYQHKKKSQTYLELIYFYTFKFV